MRLIFMGTPVFALPTLKALHQAGHEIAAVYTQPPRPAGRGQKDTPSPVHVYANEHGLPVFTPQSLKTQEAQDIFASHHADAAIVVAYGLLLPQPILDACKFGCINVHPSMLPRWRGAAPIQRTIMAGDSKTAICIMQMDAGLDTGDVLMQKNYAVPEFFNAGTLHDLLAQEAGTLVLATLEGLQSGNITPQKQSAEGVAYAKKISKEECRIDWNQPASAIYNQIRGLSPAPGAYFSYNGEKFKVFSARHSKLKSGELSPDIKSGEVLSDFLDIACEGSKSILTIEELQRPGKTRMFAADFLKGFPLPKGSRLE